MPPCDPLLDVADLEAHGSNSSLFSGLGPLKPWHTRHSTSSLDPPSVHLALQGDYSKKDEIGGTVACIGIYSETNANPILIPAHTPTPSSNPTNDPAIPKPDTQLYSFILNISWLRGIIKL
jgi:hypothetical protein